VTVTNSPALNIVGANKQKMALTYGDDQVVGTRRQTGAATIDYSDMMFVGYGINAPERDWNDYAGANHYRTNHYRKPLPNHYRTSINITGHPSTPTLPDIHQQASHYQTSINNHYRTSIKNQPLPQPLPR
jgi:hypothetical protein